MDLLIGSQALSVDAVRVTNDRAFAQLPGLSVEDWTEESPQGRVAPGWSSPETHQAGPAIRAGVQVNLLMSFIVIIVGGLGSTLGGFVGALLVGLMTNGTGYLAPRLALFSNIARMVAVRRWRPQGRYPVKS